MIRLLATAALFAICFFLGLQQQHPAPKNVIAVSMRRTDKAAFTAYHVSTANTNRTVATTPAITTPAITTPVIITPAIATEVTTPGITSVITDMLAPTKNSDQCLSVADSDLSAAPAIVLKSCRGLADQSWIYGAGSSQWQLAMDPTYCLATVNNTPNAGERLTVRPCVDSRALTLLPNPTLTASYQISGTAYVLDSGVYGYVGLAWQNGWSFQYWRWFQEDLAVVTTEGCQIDYPLPATDNQTHAREVACDRVAKMQPPYRPPLPELEKRTLFPGSVPTTVLTTTATYTFDLNFKSHGYLRQSSTPANWKSTGLYAPPGQIIRVTVSDATSADLANVYLRIGVHTDQLTPTSGNVKDGNFLRYPNVTIQAKLEPGVNLVRSPYGGPIILDGGSGAGVDNLISVEIANAVQAPYFHAGITTELEWLVRRALPIPYAEIESDLAVIHVPTTEVRNLGYQDMLALAQYYSKVGELHNELSGLAAAESPIHQPPLGKYRHVEDIQISAGWGHSGFPAMYFNAWQIGVPELAIYRSTGWGVWHELGHNYQMGLWSGVYGTETTVNLWSLYAQEKLFGNSRLVDNDQYAQTIAILNDSTVTDKWNSVGVWGQLVFLDQIRLAFPALDWELWTALIRRYREMDTAEVNSFNGNDQGKRDQFMKVLCELTGTNLTLHFDRWTVPITQDARDDCASFAPLTIESWLIDGAKPQYYRGNGTGALTREWWNDINGTSISDLTNHATFPSHPTAHSILTGTLEGPRDWSSNYGEKLRGYLYPPVTGDYEFWLAGDDATQFWLSSDEDPQHLYLLLDVTGNTSYRDFDKYVNAVQRSTTIPLTAGRRYYFEALHTEASGSDHLAVAWTIPAGNGNPMEVRKVIDARYLSPFSGDLALRQQISPHHAAIILPGADVEFTVDLFNQGTATSNAVELITTVPTGFTLSPNDATGWEGGYRYARFVAESEAGNRGDWASMAELGLLDETGAAIPHTNWRVHFVDSANGDAPAYNAIDGDPSTIWHTKWWGGTDPYPHELQIDLGRRYLPTGFTYLPRQSGVNGCVGNYRFYLSVDGINWIEVAQGIFSDDDTLKAVSFTAPPVTQRFRRIEHSLAPGAVVSLTLTLRADDTAVDGLYTSTTEIIAAWDSNNSPLYDSDAQGDTLAYNDTVVDDALYNEGNDEDDHDIALFEVRSILPTATPTATSIPTVTQTATPLLATATPTPTPSGTPTVVPTVPSPLPLTSTPISTPTATPTATATALSPATSTATPITTVTQTETPFAIATPTPSSTPTVVPTVPSPLPLTSTPISTSTATPTATATALSPATSTATPVATATRTGTPIAILTPTPTPSRMPTATPTVTAISTATAIAVATNTAMPTATATGTPTQVAPIATATPTATLGQPNGADSDYDGITDNEECRGSTTCPDDDNDGYPNHLDIDSDGDGIPDHTEANSGEQNSITMSQPVDTDGDQQPDYLDPDSDNDTILDAVEGHDGNGDGKPDYVPLNQDRDHDGLDDAYDRFAAESHSAENAAGSIATLPSHSGGQPDWRNSDDDGDGIPTIVEVNNGPLDSNGNGIPDYLESNIHIIQIFVPLVSR